MVLNKISILVYMKIKPNLTSILSEKELIGFNKIMNNNTTKQ